MNLITGFKYRPEIDGLRALAVLVVVFYHVGLGFPGGFIGVDIFFVISGYLITSLIVKELQENRFSFLNFYERRIRRIFPASATMVILTMVMGWFLLLPSDFKALGKSVISQTFFSSNIYFWRNTNYFAESAELQPLLHTWSLSVEEQFYMVVPLLLWALIKWAKISSRIKLITVLATAFFMSLALSIFLLPKMQAFTFYMLPTRAWELLIGSLVALLPIISLLKRQVVRELIVGIGLLGILLPCFLYTKETLFPGLLAIPPCLGTAFFILGASPKYNSPLPIAAKVFTWRPIIFIGLISYSLYLWHWPLIAFSNYWALEEFSILYKWSIVILSFILGIASWRFVETPFRKKTLAKNSKSLYAYAIIFSMIFLICGFVLFINKGFVNRFNETIIGYDNTKSEALHKNRITLPLTIENAKSGSFSRFGSSGSKQIDVIVWGDSHARSILPSVIKAAGEKNIVAAAWYSSTAPVLNNIPPNKYSEFSLGNESPEWAEAIITQVNRQQIPNVLLVARWSGYYKALYNQSNENPNAIENFNANLLKTVKTLDNLGVKVWVLREIPGHHISVPKALIKEELFGTDIDHYKCDKNNLLEQNKYFDALQSKLELNGAIVLDATELLFNKKEEYYRMELDGKALYYDDNHLSQAGARKISEIFDLLFN
ncbi:acyltransferase [Winogradskyella litoriviva]|uniref:Acyltransferase n=1 Tax=Winogradskyella litoriviva TaxID=1220182 RepID=A0ABX2E5G2_9FLAO|nr:acyltransferase family protein [Winogradskyella litoriviva]NRD23241.1 acyltransferase [Winogradskyella litoriviva]